MRLAITVSTIILNALLAAYHGTLVTSPPDIITNFAILILPIPSLIKLQMHWAKKLAVVGIFLLGSL